MCFNRLRILAMMMEMKGLLGLLLVGTARFGEVTSSLIVWLILEGGSWGKGLFFGFSFDLGFGIGIVSILYLWASWFEDCIEF